MLASALATAGAGQARSSSEPALPASRVTGVHANRAVPLDLQFRDPPSSARPRVWWHWMDGNVTKDGIATDIAVLAVPMSGGAGDLPIPAISGPDGKPLDAAALTGTSLAKPQKVAHGTIDQPAIILARFDQPQTVRSVTLFLIEAKGMLA